jgi:hypothetical protein
VLVPKGKQDKVRKEQPAQPAAPVVSSELPPGPPKKATRPVTAADLLVRSEIPLTPIDKVEGKGTRWTFRHPDLDGSTYEGVVHLPRLDRYLTAEGGFVSTEKAEEREALKAMGWHLWRTEIPDARPVRFASSF